MSDTAAEGLNLGNLPAQAGEAVQSLAETLRADLGENLRSLSVVGSALTQDFDPARSDINTVLVVGRRSHELLGRIASYGRTMGRKHLRAPLLMTPEYIERSVDVFGVELLDFQLNHLTVVGDDPFDRLEFTKSDVRLQCERELKASLIGLRQGYIRSMGDHRLIGEVLAGCLGNVLPVMRAMLWLEGRERSPLANATIAAAADAFGFDAATLAPVVRLRRHEEKARAETVDASFEGLYRVVDLLSRKVDELELKA